MGRAKPPKLQPGANVRVVAPCSPLFDRRERGRGARRLEAAGYRVTFGAHVDAKHGYLAGTPTERTADIHAAFTDDTVDAVLALRGGYGAGQVLPLLDFDLIAANPKPLVGMSDVTMLHIAIGRNAGLVTFWGPNLAAGLGRASDYTWASFQQALTGEHPPGPVRPAPGYPDVETIIDGVTEGPLVGGTTSLVAATLGTPYEIDTAGAVLFLEDVDEEPYRVDRLLTQLHQAGKLSAAAGIVLAEHVDVRPRRHDPSFPGGSLSLTDVFDTVVAPLGRPTIQGLPLGHGRHLATVPLGVPARLDAGAATLDILEPGVR
jgi:muramoyltetrapeptide carboxypeptidase